MSVKKNLLFLIDKIDNKSNFNYKNNNLNCM